MVYSYQINGLKVKTGDLICTTDGDGNIRGQFWRLIGKLIPGDVDHIVVYVGPGGRCVEAGPKGVISFEVFNNAWDAEAMSTQRGPFIDSLYGVAYPLEGKGFNKGNYDKLRESVAEYCLRQLGKPYNIDFLDSSTEDSFYCSQLAYKAYQKYGINLNTNIAIPEIPGTETIIYPQEIWNGCVHERA